MLCAKNLHRKTESTLCSTGTQHLSSFHAMLAVGAAVVSAASVVTDNAHGVAPLLLCALDCALVNPVVYCAAKSGLVGIAPKMGLRLIQRCEALNCTSCTEEKPPHSSFELGSCWVTVGVLVTAHWLGLEAISRLQLAYGHKTWLHLGFLVLSIVRAL